MSEKRPSVWTKRGSPHGPEFFRHEAARLRWLAAAPGGPRVVTVVKVDDDEIALEKISVGRATPDAALRLGRSLARMHDAGAAAWGEPAEAPARIHGDLWTGTVLWASARDGGGPAGPTIGEVPTAVLIDSAAHGGHRETDLAMLDLFGAPYLAEILAGYQEEHPLSGGWRDRVPLHQLHPLATHSAGHGAGYAIAMADAARAVLRM